MKHYLFSLRFTIPAILLVFSSGMSITSCHREVTEAYVRTEKSASEEIHSRGDQISGILEYLYNQGDRKQAEIVLTKMGNDPKLELALLFNEKDQILFSTRYSPNLNSPSDIPTDLDAHLFSSVRQHRTPLVHLSPNRKMVHAVYPVVLGSELENASSSRVGILVLQFNLSTLKQEDYRDAISRSLEIGAILTLFCTGLWLFFHRILTRRVEKLVAASNSLARGQFASRTRLGGADELAQISAAFDRMAERIERDTAALQQSEARFRSLVENLPGTVYRCGTDSEWTMEFISEAIGELSGYPAVDFIENNVRSFASIIHPDDRIKVEKAISRGIEEQKPYTIEYRLLHADGSQRWVYDRGQAIYGETSEIIGLDGVIFDISGRKTAEETARWQAALLRSMADASPLAFLTIDNQTNTILYFNHRFCQLWGLEDLEAQMHVNQLDNRDLIRHCSQQVATLANAWQPLRDDQNRLTLEDEMRLIDGRIIRRFSTQLRDEGDRYFGRLYIFEDISDRKTVEIDLQQAKEAAEAANKAKTEFLARMSHELRTPLNAILGFAQILNRDATLTTEQRRAIDIINRSGEHLLVLIDDILEMSKIEAGRLKLNETAFELHLLLERLQEMLHLKAASKGLTLTLECSPGLPRYIAADESKLRQVLLNLLGNGIKFTDKGSVILRVRATQDARADSAASQSLVFEVEDTGAGIPPGDLPMLFEAFVQTEIGRHSQQGTGLGLAISRKFVRLMGGDIRVCSAPGQGSIFQFDIPIRVTATEGLEMSLPTTQRVKALAPNQQTYRLLAIDDRWEHRQLFVRLLTPLGFQVKEAVNGRDGIEIWQSWQPHIIFLDMEMPVMDGRETARRIKSTPLGQTTVVIAVTASALAGERDKILANGCDDFMSKPFRETEILERLARHLGARYIYDSNPLAIKSPLAIQPLKPADLATMSSEWIDQLHRAVSACSEKQILKLIEEIPTESAFLKTNLVALAQHFRYDTILELTKLQR